MKKLVIGLALAALAAGSAYAVESRRPSPDTDGNGIITRAEAEAMSARLFARMDANGDGQLDVADRAGRRSVRFDAIDTNGDGQISPAEFAAPRARAGMHGSHGVGHRMMMVRRIADTDGNGAISRAEFTAVALRRFDRLDADRDGRVTREEREVLRTRMRDPRAAPPPR